MIFLLFPPHPATAPVHALLYGLTIIQNMANLIRSAKSGSDWTRAELDAYNITISDQDAANFFGLSALPQPTIDQELLQIQDANLMVNEKNAELINLLDLAMLPGSEESAVVDFTVELFKTLGYVRRHRVARTRKDIPLLICREQRHAKTDACIIDRSQNNIMMLVQEDKRFSGSETATAVAEAQLVAGAIAAFSYNNEVTSTAGLPVHASRVCPCDLPSPFSQLTVSHSGRLSQAWSWLGHRLLSIKFLSRPNSNTPSAMAFTRLIPHRC